MSDLRGNSGYRLSLGAGAAIGAITGWLYFPEPRAIDGALVLANIVSYPPDSAQGIYFHNMWTAVHQILALPLWLGVDQALLINLFNAVLGASFVAGLALVMFALTDSVALSLPGALLVIFSGVFLPGPDYPILFISGHSYGQTALSLSVLCVGFLGNRRYLPAGLVAGALPAFHPVIGCWTIGVALAGSLLAPAGFKADMARLLKGLAGGLVFTAISFGVYWLHRMPVALPVDAAAFSTYLNNWDAHRNVVYTPRTAAVTAVVLILLWLLFDSGRRFSRPRVVQTAVVLMISAAGSLVLYELVHRFHAALPAIVSGAMLGRLVNLHYLLAFPVIAGLLCLRRETAPVLLAAAALLAFAYTNRLLFLVVLASIAAVMIMDRVRKSRRQPDVPYVVGRGYAACFAAIGIAGSGAGLYSLSTASRPPCSSEFIVIEGCRIPEVFRKIAKLDLPGLVIAPTGLAMMTHRHGHKPVILGASGFDFVPYLPQTAAQVKSILESIYGLDFRDPPPQYRHRGNLLPGMGKEYWSALSTQEWHAMASKFCLGAVVASTEWKIHLDPVLEEDGIRVYALPRAHLAQCKISP